jgi:hypothetical protein
MVLSLLLFCILQKLYSYKYNRFYKTIDARYLKDEKQFSIMWYNLGMIVVYCVIAFTIAFCL